MGKQPAWYSVPGPMDSMQMGKSSGDREPEFESQRTALPRLLTDIQESGNALQFDGLRKRYVKTQEFSVDKPNGYGKTEGMVSAPPKISNPPLCVQAKGRVLFSVKQAEYSEPFHARPALHAHRSAAEVSAVRPG